MDRKRLLEELMGNIDAMRKRMLYGDARAKERITPQQWVVMRVIAHNPACTVKDIAERMRMSSSAATQIVEKLVRNGYVTRKAHPGDRRAVSIALAPKMEREVSMLKKRALRRMLVVFDALTDKELSQFVALHKKIVANLPKRTP